MRPQVHAHVNSTHIHNITQQHGPSQFNNEMIGVQFESLYTTFQTSYCHIPRTMEQELQVK